MNGGLLGCNSSVEVELATDDAAAAIAPLVSMAAGDRNEPLPPLNENAEFVRRMAKIGGTNCADIGCGIGSGIGNGNGLTVDVGGENCRCT